MSKVLFLYQDESMPSSRIRVLNLIPELRRLGLTANAMQYPKIIYDKVRMLRSLKQYDIVFLQKKLVSPFETLAIRKLSRKMIFDFDDAIYYRDDTHVSFESMSRRLKFRYLVRHVDLVIAGSRVLADYTSNFQKNVVIIPSAVRTDGVPVRNHEKTNDEIIIGWIGSKGNLHHLKMLSPVLQRLVKEYCIRLHVICSESLEIPGVKVKFVPWSVETQEREIALFDIGLMPLPDNKWTEGKCGYKALQYMACSVPPICSDVGSNRDIIVHGKEGFLASKIDDFYSFLVSLIKSGELRKECGSNARERVESQFAIPVVAKRLRDVLVEF